MGGVKRFEGRHVLVTGAARGIGRAIARRLVDEGARVTVVDRLGDELRGVADELGGTHAEVCDIRVREEVDRAFAAAVAAGGPLAALVANAGVGGPNEPGEGDRFEELVATNLVGTYWCLRAAQGRLGGGPGTRHLVVVSSVLARIAVPRYSGYSASKAGLLGLVRSLAAELAPDDVQVNAVLPSWTDTDMARQGLDEIAALTGGTVEEAHELAMRDVPLGRMSAPEDIAGVVAWLLSDDARGVTGQGIDVNGGAWM
jgi:NAD(P)-dependent dehydrogenase (short-subunit alcohol dehydrogenase family)